MDAMMVQSREFLLRDLGKGCSSARKWYNQSTLKTISRRTIMSKVVKVIEVLSQSDKSWEDAAAKAVKAAAKSIDNIKSIYIVDFSAKVNGDKIVKYRINAKISFLIDNNN